MNWNPLRGKLWPEEPSNTDSIFFKGNMIFYSSIIYTFLFVNLILNESILHLFNCNIEQVRKELRGYSHEALFSRCSVTT